MTKKGGPPIAVARATAAASVVYGVVALVVGAVLDAKIRAAGVDQAQQLAGPDIAYVAAWAASALVGATLLVRRPAHPVGWLFTALGATLVTWGLSESLAVYGLFVRLGSFPGATAAAVIANSIFIVTFVLVALVCSLTPDGRFLSDRWRTASRVMVIAAATWLALRLVSPQPLEDPFSSIENPWRYTAVDPKALRMVAAIVANSLVLASVVSLFLRFRRPGGPAVTLGARCCGLWSRPFQFPPC